MLTNPTIAACLLRSWLASLLFCLLSHAGLAVQMLPDWSAALFSLVVMALCPFDTSVLRSSGSQSLVLNAASPHLSIRRSAQFELYKPIWRDLQDSIMETEYGAGLDLNEVDMGQHQRRVTPFVGG